MNAEEAEKCYEKGQHYFKAGDYLNAQKFINKSVRLNPTEQGFKLMHTIEEKLKEKQQEEQKHSDPHVHHRTHEEKKHEKEEPTQRNYTQTQVDEIRKMKNLKDFYEILGVDKNANEEEIKKKYKKLALKFHPDKNRAPGSDEIFKKIAQAYDCLTNKEKRDVYDRYGNESPEEHYQHYRQRYAEDISPEDIFSFFFSNAFDPDMTFRTARRNGHQRFHEQQQNPRFARGGQHPGPYWNLVNMLPLIFIFLSLFVYNGQEEPHYLMERTRKYHIEMRTNNLDLTYFVEPTFKDKYKPGSKELGNIEREIEWNYINNLRSHCNYQTNLKKSLEYQAYYSSRYQQEILQKKASEIDMQSCRELERIKKRGGYSSISY